MQDQAGRHLILIQRITIAWTEQTHNEEGDILRTGLPVVLDLPPDLPEPSADEYDRTADKFDILCHSIFYDEWNQYQEPSQQSWSAHYTYFLDREERPFGKLLIPPGLTAFSLPSVSPSGTDYEQRMDLIKQEGALNISFWQKVSSRSAPYRYPGLKNREFTLSLEQWAQMGMRSRSISADKPPAYLKQITNVGYAGKFSPTFFCDRSPIYRDPSPGCCAD